MRITEASMIKGRHGKSWEYVILGSRSFRGKIHRVKIDWHGHQNSSPVSPIIMDVGHIGRLLSTPYWFWVVEEMSKEEESHILCEMCREETNPKYKHYGHGGKVIATDCKDFTTIKGGVVC